MAHQVEEPEDTLHLNGNHAVTTDTPKVGELVNSLMVAMRENQRWHTIIEGCNEVMMEHVEVTESRQQETENLKAMLSDYKVKIAQLENTTEFLQD